MHWFWVLVGVALAPPGSKEPECVGCHPSQSQLHAQSRHAVAWTNPLFRGEYDGRPKEWCVGCHAPGVDAADRSKPPTRAQRGVSCKGCHVIGGELVSTSRSFLSPHETRSDAQFASASQCARCHQFNFPVLGERGELIRYTDEPMQATYFEFLASEREGSCTTCHDPHRAAGSHSVETVRSAMTTSLCQDGQSVELRITNSGAGHNLPTGGVHRYISARLWRSSSPSLVRELRLGREFGPGSDSARKTLSDTTIRPGRSRSLRASLDTLGGSPSEPINAELRYHYAVSPDAVLADGSQAQRTIERWRLQPAALPSCESPARKRLSD